jgi:hypothetical protein
VQGGKDEAVREGYEPGQSEPLQPHGDEENHNLNRPFVVGDNPNAPGGEDFSGQQSEPNDWQHRDYDE